MPSTTSPHRAYAAAHMFLALFSALAASLLPPASWGAEKPQGPGGEAPKWSELFDGKTLKNWEVLEKFDFKNHGRVHVDDGCLVLDAGQPGTGVRFTGKLPQWDYEVALEAKRLEGGDFFCATTFPVGDKALTLIMGGWGGWVVGLSCIDGYYAVDNETCQSMQFEQNRWYRVRLRVTRPAIHVWIDDKELITLETKDRKFNVSWEMEPCQPFGFATWYTQGAVRHVRYRPLGQQEASPQGPAKKKA